MPCSSDGQDEYYNEQQYGVRDTSGNIATRVACEACRVLDDRGLLDYSSELLQKWWKAHVRWDKENQ